VDLLIFVARKPAPWNLEAQEVVQLVPAMGCNGFVFFGIFLSWSRNAKGRGEISHIESQVVVSHIFHFHPDPWGNDPI